MRTRISDYYTNLQNTVLKYPISDKSNPIILKKCLVKMKAISEK